GEKTSFAFFPSPAFVIKITASFPGVGCIAECNRLELIYLETAVKAISSNPDYINGSNMAPDP
ncbi:MAG: hypothetical protein AB1589_13685, partial [Cyanobacteriota bacterium]